MSMFISLSKILYWVFCYKHSMKSETEYPEKRFFGCDTHMCGMEQEGGRGDNRKEIEIMGDEGTMQMLIKSVLKIHCSSYLAAPRRKSPSLLHFPELFVCWVGSYFPAGNWVWNNLELWTDQEYVFMPRLPINLWFNIIWWCLGFLCSLSLLLKEKYLVPFVFVCNQLE